MKTLRFVRRYVLAEMLVLLALFATPVRADREGDFIFNRDGATAWLWGYVGPGGAVVIPDRLGNLPVATISLAFSGRTDLTGVTIPNSVTSIGGSAFSGCTGLMSVTIPDSVTDIGYLAFSDCTGLTSVTIPSSVRSISDEAFSGCTGLTSVTIPSSVRSISDKAFSGCTGLRAIEVDSLNLVYSSAEGVLFDKAKSRLFVYPTSKAGPYTIPNSVTSIGYKAFSGCTGLTGVTIPNCVTSIGDSAFAGCTGLTSVTIPNSVTEIVSAAFAGCTALRAIEVDSLNLAYTSAAGVLFNKAKSWLIAYPAGKAGPYTIPNSVTDILWFAFSGCTGLTSVTVPSSVTFIRMVAFAGCKSLTSINLPTSLTSISSSAFSGCSGLTGVTIPDSVTYIGHWAFSGCTALTTVTIPNAVTEIGVAAFTSCTGLTNVTISDGVTGIPPAMFQGCTALTSVVLPQSITYIGRDAFSDCTGLTGVTIPSSVINIDYPAFSRCTALKAIEVDSLNPAYSSAEGILFNKAQSVLYAYPAGKAGPYQVPGSVTKIGDYAFSGCTALTSVTIPKGVTSIGWYAFSGCDGLGAIEVDSLNMAYRSAEGVLFNKTQSVLIEYPGGKSGAYTIPSSVTAIRDMAFSGCTGLTSVTISDGVTSLSNSIFQGCTGLTSVFLPKSITNVGGGAFSDCTGLTSVYCEGNAPDVMLATEGVFLGSGFVTVFYRAGTAGWRHTFAGRPTAVWVPRPAFGDWAVSTSLAAQFPNASAEGDDPDGDGFTNGDEWFAATDPTQRASRLELELTPRPADLSASDQTPIKPGQHAVYLRSVPGHYYGVQRATSLGGAWELQATKVATATQTRFVLPKPADHAFYRVLALP